MYILLTAAHVQSHRPVGLQFRTVLIEPFHSLYRRNAVTQREEYQFLFRATKTSVRITGRYFQHVFPGSQLFPRLRQERLARLHRIRPYRLPLLSSLLQEVKMTSHLQGHRLTLQIQGLHLNLLQLLTSHFSSQSLYL